MNLFDDLKDALNELPTSVEVGIAVVVGLVVVTAVAVWLDLPTPLTLLRNILRTTTGG